MSGDPMLDGITRWTHDGPPAYPYETGGYVLFSDLPALLAAAREDERGNKRYSENEMDAQTERYHKVGYEQGQRDEREAAARIVALSSVYSFDEAMALLGASQPMSDPPARVESSTPKEQI